MLVVLRILCKPFFFEELNTPNHPCTRIANFVFQCNKQIYWFDEFLLMRFGVPVCISCKEWSIQEATRQQRGRARRHPSANGPSRHSRRLGGVRLGSQVLLRYQLRHHRPQCGLLAVCGRVFGDEWGLLRKKFGVPHRNFSERSGIPELGWLPCGSPQLRGSLTGGWRSSNCESMHWCSSRQSMQVRAWIDCSKSNFHFPGSIQVNPLYIILQHSLPNHTDLRFVGVIRLLFSSDTYIWLVFGSVRIKEQPPYKTHELKEIGLRLQILLTTPHLIVNTRIGRTYVFS